jgi:membrane-bound lytic murein transglycosylase MltF
MANAQAALEPKMQSMRIVSLKTYAKFLVIQSGGTIKDWKCVDAIYTMESHWIATSHNSSSGAWGIPQALPASKMAVEGLAYKTNPYIQIKWGQRYFKFHWGNRPCDALAFHNRHGYY